MSSSKRKKNVAQPYTHANLRLALQDIRKGKSFGKAAEEYQIPKSTLHAKASGKTPEICKKGPQTVLLPEEEERIKTWILKKARLGFPMHTEDIKNAVQKSLNDSGRKTTFTDNRPGDKWFKLFLKRHPGIVKRNTDLISRGRASVTEEKLRNWFQEIQTYLIEIGSESILERPGSIFNADETGVELCPKLGKRLGSHNEKDFYEVASGQEKKNVTVLCTFSAVGNAILPMILYPYKRIPANIANSVPDEWPIGRSDTGWMQSCTFFEYMRNFFYPWFVRNQIQFPVIFYFDGHKSHLSLEVSEFCSEKNIILVCLYPNATHIIQPCDVIIFRALKVKWSQVVLEHKQKTHKPITLENFAPLFKIAFDQIKSSSVVNGFKVCGLYPFDENAVKYNKCISTRRKDIYEKEIENSNASLEFEDFLSTKKFFKKFLAKEQLEKFVDMRENEQEYNDPVYFLWKTCYDHLENCSNDNATADFQSVPIRSIGNEVHINPLSTNDDEQTDEVLQRLPDPRQAEANDSCVENLAIGLNSDKSENCDPLCNFDVHSIDIADIPITDVSNVKNIDSFIEVEIVSSICDKDSISLIESTKNMDFSHQEKTVHANEHDIKSVDSKDVRTTENPETSLCSSQKEEFDLKSDNLKDISVQENSKTSPYNCNNSKVSFLEKEMSNNDKNHPLENVESDDEFSAQIDMNGNNIITDEKSIVQVDDNIIRSHAKSLSVWDNLPWPKNEMKVTPKVKMQEKLPFVVTSKEFQLQKKLKIEEKLRKELEAKNRALQNKIKKEETEIAKERMKEERERKKRERDEENNRKRRFREEEKETRKREKERENEHKKQQKREEAAKKKQEKSKTKKSTEKENQSNGDMKSAKRMKFEKRIDNLNADLKGKVLKTIDTNIQPEVHKN